MLGQLGLIMFASKCNMANFNATKIMICLGLILYLTGGDVDAARKINDKSNNPGKGRKPPTILLSASPTTVSMNGSTTINWSSKHASDCTASGGWFGSKATSGSQTISALTTNSSFSLSCTGPGGSVNDSVSVTVAVPEPSLSFSANPVTLAQNGSTTLNWSANDATSCTASGDWSGNKGASGVETINSLMIDSQFTLTCTAAGGTVNETVNVTVMVSNNELVKPSVNLTTENNNIYLNWSQSNANQYRVLYWQGKDAPQEQITTGTEYTFPPLTIGSYTVIVEAYDEMGNSLFSVPVALEVF
jgi:hypothetical protein